MKDIESLLMAFLWSGSEMRSSCAKVKWSSIYCPKREGELGFKKLKEWNKAFMLKHLRVQESRHPLGKMDPHLHH